MCKIIAISNRLICPYDFKERIKEINDLGIDIILREKDLDEYSYKKLFKELCCPHVIPHSFTLKNRVHLPLNILREKDFSGFDISTSVHSVDEAREAQELGARLLIAGHIFETDCKYGLAGRGLGFIGDIKNAVDIPVFAIGGITKDNAKDVIKAGADGICIMSGFMKCSNVKEFLKGF